MTDRSAMLDREEYIEQAYFFRALLERSREAIPLQEMISGIRDEVLATTKLPMALDFLRAELLHCGMISTAMERLPHYFSTFQTYVMSEAEMERGRFDFGVALKILQTEAEYRAKQGGRQGLFLYHFETLCRNRLRYDQGLKAMADDVAYDADWADWILHVRKQVGLIDIAEMVYFRSEYYLQERARRGMEPPPNPMPMLFGQKEGRIALANRRRDPLLLFAALQRQLDYPPVPRLTPVDETPELIPQLMRRVERIETRIKLVEEEQRGGIDITRFYGKQNDETDDDNVSP